MRFDALEQQLHRQSSAASGGLLHIPPHAGLGATLLLPEETLDVSDVAHSELPFERAGGLNQATAAVHCGAREAWHLERSLHLVHAIAGSPVAHRSTFAVMGLEATRARQRLLQGPLVPVRRTR
eukprot:scaffold2144_cov334-Prasinococcus_capsulatus_cf.AAC.4